MRVGEKGQVVIPKRLRDEYGIRKHSDVEFVPRKDGILIRKRTTGVHPVDEVYGIVKLKYADSVDEYIEEIRGR